MTAAFFPSPEFTLQIWGLTLAERYSHPIEEYITLREGCGAVDVTGFEYLRVSGKDAGTLLQGLLSNHVKALETGGSSPGWLLDSNGKITQWLLVHRYREEEFVLQCMPGSAHSLKETLDTYIFMEDVQLKEEATLLTWSIQGHKAEPLEMETAFEFEHHRCGEPGWDIAFTSEQQPRIEEILRSRAIVPIGFTALNIRRVENLVPWFGVEMEKGKLPLIYGKNASVSYSKGCFLGQESIAMTRDRGRPPALLCLMSSAKPQLPPNGTPLLSGERIAGTLTSIVFSPEHEKPIATAMVQYTLATSGQTLIDQTGQSWRIERVVPWKSDS
jgi:folate-binding protein YgfZ